MKMMLKRLLPVAAWLAVLSLSATAMAGAKCPHDAAQELCFFCDAALREKGRLWCKEHDRYEDRCWECHAELEDKARAFCAKHKLYVDECFLCRPELKATPKAAAEAAPAGPRLMCKEHNVAEDECGICHPDLAGKIEPGRGLKVRFASAQAAAKAGIETAPAQVGPMADGIECYAELQFNQNQLAQIAVPAGGIIQSIEAELGDKVEQGQLLATVWSAAIGEAVAKAVLTLQTVTRERKLRADRISSEKDLQEAEASYRSARQQLKTLGFDEKQIEALAAQSVETAMLELRAPFAGELVERNAVRGALVDAGTSLFTLVDRSTMWAMLNIPERLLAGVRLGQTVEFRVDALPDQTFTGLLTWIAAKVDDRTRMAQGRAEIADPDGALRAQMFAKARILTGHSEKAVIVPTSALQRIEKRSFVFVRVADDLYEARRVRLGATRDGSVAIAEGVSADEAIVVEGSFIAKSQLLISKLGAGCVD